jgi:cardiolipin synthase A/B
MLTAILATLLVILVVVLSVVIWSIKRHRDPELHIECDQPIDKLVASLAGLTLSTVVDGNSVEVFENGAFFDVLIADIGQARHSVHFETFLWEEWVLATRIADALNERAKAGLQVRVLLDAIGSKKMGDVIEHQMKSAGCKVVKFHHHHHVRNIGVFHERDHRKIVVLDGKVAFVGGHCVKDDWLGDAEDGKHFADVSVRVRGPVVANVQAAFGEN